MSLSDYSTLLKEGVKEIDSIRVEHVFTFGVSETTLQRIADTCLVVSRRFAESFKILSIAMSAFLFLYGSSKLLESINESKRQGDA